MKKRVFFTAGQPAEEGPMGMDCMPNCGATKREALNTLALYKEDDDDSGDPGYWDRLRLFKITVEEIPR